MPIEQLMQAVISADPKKRREVEAVLQNRATVADRGSKSSQLITIGGAAKLLAVSRSTVAAMLRTGRLDAVNLNGTARRVTLQSLNELIEGRRNGNTKLIAEEKARRSAYYQAHKPSAKKED